MGTYEAKVAREALVKLSYVMHDIEELAKARNGADGDTYERLLTDISLAHEDLCVIVESYSDVEVEYW